MRTIEASAITQAVAQLCQEANFELGDDVLGALKQAEEYEESPLGKEVLSQLIENARIAREERLPLCQDCGIVVVFLEIGQEVNIINGDLNEAVEEGVHQGYNQGHLRKSMVDRPFSVRINTTDNTPPVTHIEIIPGDRLRIMVIPKGAGAESMSKLEMLKPSDGRQGIIDAVVKTVDEAGGNACPPLIIGLGLAAPRNRQC